MVRARIIAASVALALCTLPAWGEGGAGSILPQDVDRETAELDRLRRELEGARAAAKQAASKEKKVLQQLNTIDSDLGLKERLLTGLQRKQMRLDVELGQTRDKLAAQRKRLDERRTVLRRRLRNIYMFGERPGLQVLLGASSAVDLVRRFDWLLLVAQQDRILYNSIQEAVRAVHDAEAELLAKGDDLETVRAESEREKGALMQQRQERNKFLGSIRTEKIRHEKVVKELEDAEREVQRVLAQLESRGKSADLGELPPAGTSFAAAKGKLLWPVEGKVVRWFGVQKDKRFGTSTFNGGMDIQSERESDVVAVHRGRADYVNWLPGYGQCIILNHGDGYYSLYAHTSSVYVKPGDLVAAGDVIASVGDTGSLLGNILHFEIRKDAEPVNPAPWLRAVRLR
jgi:septal ring factor EnvC (AmiA/AmiB activator)